MTDVQVFLSYETRSHSEVAAAIAAVLTNHGIDVWHDERARRSVRRRVSRRGGELGLDSWLRRGLLTSQMIVVLVPYSHVGEFPDHIEGIERLPRPLAPDDIANRVWTQYGELKDHYYGDVPSEHVNVDQLAYYMFRPFHWFRSGHYEDRFGVAVGNDPFEGWRLTEIRTAGAFSLVPVLVVPIEIEDDVSATEVASQLSKGHVVVIRIADLARDIENNLVPAIRRNAPDAQRLERIHELQVEFRRLRLPAFLHGAAWAIGMVLFFLVMLVWDLLKILVPVGLVGLVVYLLLRWIGVL